MLAVGREKNGGIPPYVARVDNPGGLAQTPRPLIQATSSYYGLAAEVRCAGDAERSNAEVIAARVRSELERPQVPWQHPQAHDFLTRPASRSGAPFQPLRGQFRVNHHRFIRGTIPNDITAGC